MLTCFFLLSAVSVHFVFIFLISWLWIGKKLWSSVLLNDPKGRDPLVQSSWVIVWVIWAHNCYRHVVSLPLSNSMLGYATSWDSVLKFGSLLLGTSKSTLVLLPWRLTGWHLRVNLCLALLRQTVFFSSIKLCKCYPLFCKGARKFVLEFLWHRIYEKSLYYS